MDRVVAIVSRIQGVYEFDVQTLREYFAAKHLYITAPYSPAGAERKGTISDRWHALSRNFYWFNVARFYAGCYSEGELASLLDELRVLVDDDEFSSTNHPQLLLATLLGDWVFSQRPRVSESAVDLLLDPRRLRLLISGVRFGSRQFGGVIVRDPVGKNRLLETCKQFISSDRPLDQLVEVINGVLRPNTDTSETFDWWKGKLTSSGEAQADKWCAIGQILQCWSSIGIGELEEILATEKSLKETHNCFGFASRAK